MFDVELFYASRRSIVIAGMANLLVSAVRAGGKTRPLIVPEVDSLTLQVIDDAATFGPFLPNLDLPGMKVIRIGNGGGPLLPRMLPRALTGEFGLSILAESRRAGEIRRVLVDFGYSREVLANNFALLGIDPQTIDAAVLSHGHLDHYGGYAALFGAHAKGARPIPLTVGGEETF